MKKSMKMKKQNEIVVHPRTCATTYRPERQEVGTAIIYFTGAGAPLAPPFSTAPAFSMVASYGRSYS